MITARLPLPILFFFALLLSALASAPVGAQDEQTAVGKPNIVLILADDMGYGDLGCYNSRSLIPTPAMDRIATQGMRFTDMHSPSAVCSPTRYALLTGRYAWRTALKRGVLWGDSPLLVPVERMTVASLLQDNGYETACIGKWHLGLGKGKTDYSKPLRPGPLDIGFDSFFGIPATLDMEPYVYVVNDRVEKDPIHTTRGGELRRYGGVGFYRGGRIAPGFRHVDVLPRTTDKAVEYITSRKAGRPEAKPFFLFFSLTAPHTPWVPTKEYDGKSKAGPYGDFVAQIDGVVDRVDRALETAGLTGNTLLIVTSDNGAHWMPQDIQRHRHLANGLLRGQKADIWEAGHRVPFVARWPEHIAAGSKSDETLCLTDLLASFATLVGAELPDNAGEDSYDMLPVLLGEAPEEPIREAIVHQSFNGFLAIRKGDWKLIFGRGSGGFTDPAVIPYEPGKPAGQLYNLAKDPRESRNLYVDMPEKVKEPTELIERYGRTGRSR